MMRLILTLLGIAIGCTHCLGPARAAESASDAVAAICPRHAEIAPAIEAAAARHRVLPVVLTALVFVESSCDPKKANRRTGCYGLAGIKVDGSTNPDHLEPAELLDPETNVELGARHLRALIGLCGSLGGGLHVYNGGKRCRDWRGGEYARRVMGMANWARAKVKRLQEKRS